MNNLPVIFEATDYTPTVSIRVKGSGAVVPLPGTIEVTLYKHGISTPFVTATVANGKLTSVGAATGDIVFNLDSAVDLSNTGSQFGSVRIARTDVPTVIVVYPVRFLEAGDTLPSDYDGTVLLQIENYTVEVKATISPAVPPGSVTNTYLADMPAGTVKARLGASAGPATDEPVANLPVSTATQMALNEKADRVNGKVPASQLPSYVDDAVEVANFAALPITGVTNTIYITLNDGKSFRWTGTRYLDISTSTGLASHISDVDPHSQYERKFVTVAEMQATNLSSFAVGTVLLVQGYSVAGVGRALWKRISTPGVVKPWHKLCGGGVYVQLDEVNISPDMFGGSHLTANNASYLQYCIDYLFADSKLHSILMNRIYPFTSSVVIDRPTDSTRDELVIDGMDDAGGFSATSDLTLFTTSITFTSAPVSEFLTIKNCRFIGPEFHPTNLYIMGGGFLRVRFLDNYTQGWKFISATHYLQQYEFSRNNVRRWAGAPWFQTTQQVFSLHAIGNTFEVGTGGVFRAANAVGCSFIGNIAENFIDRFLDFDGFDGLQISGNYTEANLAPDYRFIRTAGVKGKGINFSGNFMQLLEAQQDDANFWNVVWGGEVSGAVSSGNRCNGKMHDDTGVLPGTLIINDALDLVDNPTAVLVKSGKNYTSYQDGHRSANLAVAAAGGGAGGATPLTASYNLVTFVASPGDGVRLPKLAAAATVSNSVTVMTYSANYVYVYPASGDTIDFTGGPYLVNPNTPRTFYKSLAGNWTADAIASPQSDSTATTVTDLRADLNALLARLRTAGMLGY